MSDLGKIIATPVRILNVPNRAVEKMIDPDSRNGDEDNFLSKPLESVAVAIEEIFD